MDDIVKSDFSSFDVSKYIVADYDKRRAVMFCSKCKRFNISSYTKNKKGILTITTYDIFNARVAYVLLKSELVYKNKETNRTD